MTGKGFGEGSQSHLAYLPEAHTDFIFATMAEEWGVMGGVFVAESLSVIIQVWVFKATKGPDGQGRRVFRMAPLHHHFELGGTSEKTVVPCFWLASAALVGLGLLLRPLG